MDFTKLSAVSDSLRENKPRKVTAESVQVVEESPLDKIDTREKVVDSQSKIKVVILDSIGVKQLADLPRDERRKFLARLTDSQRRRVLTQLSKIKDSGFSERLGYSLLDSLLANAVFDPSQYNLDALKRFVDTQEYTVFEDDIKILINKVLEGSFNSDEDKDLVMSLAMLMGDQHSRLVDTITVVKSEEPEKETEKEPEEPEENVEDSVDFAINEPDQNVLDALHDLADANVAMYLSKQSSTSKMITDAENHISKYVLLGFDYNKVSDSYWSAFDKAFEEQFKSIEEFDTLAEDKDQFEKRFGLSLKEALESQEVADSIHHIFDEAESALDKVATNQLLPENENVNYSEPVTPVGKVLSKALQDYIDGNAETLDAFLEQEIEISEPESSEDTSESQTNEDSTEKTSDAAIPKWAFDAARAFKTKSLTQNIIDSCEDVPFFSEYNCIPTEYTPSYTPCEKCLTPLPPLTHDEYMTVCPPEVPDWVVPLIPQHSVLPVESYVPEKDYITVNTVAGAQNYVPLCGSIEDIESLLKGAEPQDYPHILGDKCCATDSLLNTLARVNLLNVCDSKFYKHRISDCNWTFDECPDCIPESERTLFENGGSATYGDHPDEGTVIVIYGVPYTFQAK